MARPIYKPTRKEIKAASLRIRNGWTPKERERRRGHLIGAPPPGPSWRTEGSVSLMLPPKATQPIVEEYTDA